MPPRPHSLSIFCGYGPILATGRSTVQHTEASERNGGLMLLRCVDMTEECKDAQNRYVAGKFPRIGGPQGCSGMQVGGDAIEPLTDKVCS